MAKIEAIAATVTGMDHGVGFRALVMKQAIQYNLAGLAENGTVQVVHFTLQGDKEAIDPALDTIREGTKRSLNIKITTTPIAIIPTLNTFTIMDWNSSSRQITNEYTLVFKLRDGEPSISEDDAKVVWRQILETTLNADDRKKLKKDD
jgi:acylphosphatase